MNMQCARVSRMPQSQVVANSKQTRCIACGERIFISPPLARFVAGATEEVRLLCDLCMPAHPIRQLGAP